MQNPLALDGLRDDTRGDHALLVNCWCIFILVFLSSPLGVDFSFVSLTVCCSNKAFVDVVVVVPLLELLNELVDVMHYEATLLEVLLGGDSIFDLSKY